MGAHLNKDISPWIAKIAGKLVSFAGKLLIDRLTDDNVDNVDDKKPTPTIAQQLKNNDQSGFVLGDGVAKPEAEDGHIMVVGGAGSGKSSCIAIPSLLSWEAPVFAIDIKGELFAYSNHSPKRKILVFNPLDTDPNALGYDPYYLLKHATDKVQESQAIAHALIPLPPNTLDPFWIQSAQNLYVGAIPYFFSRNFSFVETVTAILDTKITELLNEIYTGDAEHARRFVSGLLDMKPQVVSSILTVLSNHIMIFATNESVINCLTKKINITPEDLEDGWDIYVHIPENLLKQWKGLLTLIVSQFLNHAEKRPDMTAKPILFLLDEFARLGKLEGVVDGLATLRSKKITIAIILQSLAQLDLHYGKEARQVIADTCQYKAVLNVTDVESQEYFSKAVGTYDKIRVVKSQQYDRFTSFKAGSAVTTLTEEKPIIKPHEFATLEQIVLLTPHGAYKADKKPYYENTTDSTSEKTEDKGEFSENALLKMTQNILQDKGEKNG